MDDTPLIRRRPIVREETIRLKHGLRWTREHIQLRGSVLLLRDVAYEVVGATQESRHEMRVHFAGADKSLRMRSNSTSEWVRALNISATTTLTKSDFEILEPLGQGGGGDVYLVRRRGHNDGRLFAMKVVRKIDAFRSRSSLRHALDERLALELVRDSPYVVHLEHAFQDEYAFYHVTEFCGGGDLRTALRRHPKGRFSEAKARPLFAQLILALQHVHSLDVIYRDLKPENVLLSSSGGDIRLCDFGLAKVLTNGRFGRTKSFCGTTQFMAPEVVRHRSSYGIAVDLWGLGALFYRVLVGHAPFDDMNEDLSKRENQAHEMHTRIQVEDLTVPKWLTRDAQDMLYGLLQKREEDRWNMSDLMESSFFMNTNWDSIVHEGRLRRLISEKVDKVSSVTSNFDRSHLKDMTIFDGDVKRSDGVETGKRGIGRLRKLTKKASATDIVGFAFSISSTARSSTDASSEERFLP